MQDLFQYDFHDYNPEGKVFRRPSVRGIVAKEDKVLLIYSPKYDYYKFPGGGANPGETHTEALCREVREESGYCVIPESITEFGRVLRRQRDTYDENGIFEQENYYYFCDVTGTCVPAELDDYEREEGFTPVWLEPMIASRHNRFHDHKDADANMIKREEKVLDLVDLALRKRDHLAHEAKTVRELGQLDYADMLSYVASVLASVKTEDIDGKVEISYSRVEHIKRVLGWTKRLYELSDRKDEIRYEDAIIAAIFHDVGRNLQTRELSHAHAGVPLTRDYLLQHGFSEERTEYICMLVGSHSDKYRMKEPEIDKTLLLLMEADYMDDMGALGIVMDCMITQARNKEAKFVDCLDHITRYTYRIQQHNPMVSAAARQQWEKKTKLVNDFVEALNEDVLL